MGKSYLDTDELITGNRWLKTIFFPSIGDTLETNYIHYKSHSYSNIIAACKRIYEFITERLWDVNNNLENELNRLAKGYTLYKIDPAGGDNIDNTYTLTVSQICRIIANMCAKTEIFWDDTQHTPEELTYFIATPMGKALWDFRCFITQEPDTRKVSTSSSTSSTSRAASSGNSGTPSGSKLNINNAGGLVSGTKEILNATDMYWIDGIFANPGKTKPRLHVSPLNQSSPLTVKYGSGQGFDDCVLFFDDLNKAKDFYAKADLNKPSSVIQLSLKRQKTDPNGYFKVNTQFGEAYIKASKLHEALEKLEEETNNKKIEAYMEFKKAYEALQKVMK